MKQKVELTFIAKDVESETVKFIRLIPRHGACLWEVRSFRPQEVDRMLMISVDEYEARDYFRIYIERFL